MSKVQIAMPLCGCKPLRIYMTGKYIASLHRAGAAVRLIRMTDPKLEEKLLACDGLLLPGGGDIEPGRYGQTPIEKCGKPELLRDETEWKMLTAFLPTVKPILGICRGTQMLNVFLGGTLHQDIPDHSAFKNRATGTHNVTLVSGSKLAAILKQTSVFVNSMHHQATDTPAPGFSVIARSADGTIEAQELEGHPFCIGVQWHPEHLSKTRADQQAIFDAFVRQCNPQ